jgi:hypothetical protein
MEKICSAWALRTGIPLETCRFFVDGKVSVAQFYLFEAPSWISRMMSLFTAHPGQ